MWCQLVSFTILDDSASDQCLLAAVLAHPRYRDHCAGPFDGQIEHDLHGPYRIETITVDGFVSTTVVAALTVMHLWIRDCVFPEYRDSIVDSLRLIHRHVGPPLREADCIYRLVTPRRGNEHDWASVVGHCGFHEFIAIDRTRQTVWMIIASND